MQDTVLLNAVDHTVYIRWTADPLNFPGRVHVRDDNQCSVVLPSCEISDLRLMLDPGRRHDHQEGVTVLCSCLVHDRESSSVLVLES